PPADRVREQAQQQAGPGGAETAAALIQGRSSAGRHTRRTEDYHPLRRRLRERTPVGARFSGSTAFDAFGVASAPSGSSSTRIECSNVIPDPPPWAESE